MLIPYKKIFIYIFWALCFAILPFILYQEKFINHEYHDPDDYMRIVRVNQLLENRDWYNNRIERENAPYGLEMHWTRLHDACILAVAAPFLPFCTLEQSIHISASIIGVVFLLLIILLIYDIGSVFSKNVGMVSAIVSLFALGLHSYVTFLRPDVHCSLVFIFTFIVKEAIQILRVPNNRSACILGVLSGLAIWDSPELIVIIALVLSFFVIWYLKTGEIKYIPFLLKSSSIQTFIIFALVFGVERQVGDFRVEYDRVSIVHLFLSLLQTFFFIIIYRFNSYLKDTRNRIIGVGVVASVMVILLCIAFPKALYLAFGSIDSPVQRRFLSDIRELQPSVSYVYSAVYIFTMFIFCVFYFITHKVNRYYLFLAYLLCPYFILSALIIRVLPYFDIIAVILVGCFLVWIIRYINRNLKNKLYLHIIRPLIIGLVPFIVYGTPQCYFMSPLFHNNHPVRNKVCKAELAQFLNKQFTDPILICSSYTYSTSILMLTPHSVLAGPYHRNKEGIRDTEILLSSHSSADEKLKIIKKRGVDLIITNHPFEVSPSFLKEIKGFNQKGIYIYKVIL